MTFQSLDIVEVPAGTIAGMDEYPNGFVLTITRVFDGWHAQPGCVWVDATIAAAQPGSPQRRTLQVPRDLKRLK